MTTDIQFEEWKARNEANLEHYRAECQYDLEQMRTVNLAGQSALKANVFLNAGAAVAILAFLANIFNSIDAVVAGRIIFSICIFSSGALLGSIATGFTYLSQYAFQDDKKTIGSYLNVFSNLLVLISYNLFVIAGYIAFTSIGLKFNLSVNFCFHWIFGIVLSIINLIIVCVIIYVLKSSENVKNT